MMAKINARGVYSPRILSADDTHRAWLELVDTDGPFLAIPPVKQVWPTGFTPLSNVDKDIIRAEGKSFDHAWEDLDNNPDSPEYRDKYRVSRDHWVKTILRDVAGWRESLLWDEGCAPGVRVGSKGVVVTPTAVLQGSEGIGALVSVVDACDNLRQEGADGWAESAIGRMEAMLSSCGVQIGIVTDGRWWALVCVRQECMPASGIVDSQIWVEESNVRDAFLTLIQRQYIVGGKPEERLPVLFEKSVAAAEEITEALGSQVRQAVELLIQAFTENASEAQRLGASGTLPDDPKQAYEAAVTVMMQVVFLLFAQERGMLPQSQFFRQAYGISDQLDFLEQRKRTEGEESLDSTFLTWHRLLSTSQALHSGVSFEDMRIPAYGGSLFEPNRFPFLTQTDSNGSLLMTVSDRVMLHVLHSVQVAQLVNKDARRISFRDVDVEQIGYVYEGLLGYTCKWVQSDDVACVSLCGSPGSEPEISLPVLEGIQQRSADHKELAVNLVAWVKNNQPSAKIITAKNLAKKLAESPSDDAVRYIRALSDDTQLHDRLLPWVNIIRRDLRNRPAVILSGGLLLEETPSRRHAGAHYTPKSLAEEVVQHALEPLCYDTGPYQTNDRSSWVLKSSEKILSLKVADIAVGSGAFLVAAARYLADRLVEAWTLEGSRGQSLRHKAIREIVARCLYGADINEMAIEMCKLSLWLVSLEPKLPFSFVDDKIVHGNSLLGITELTQLQSLRYDPSEHPHQHLFSTDIRKVIDELIQIRRELATQIQENDPQRSGSAKHNQLKRFREAKAKLAQVADGIIAAGLRVGGKPGKALDAEYENLAEAVKNYLPTDESIPSNSGMLEAIIEAGLTPTVSTDYPRWKPVHWVLEIPDVMTDHSINHGGFDAIIGNPPFLGGSKLSSSLGSNIREWFVYQIAHGIRGNADLVAYFFLRAFSLLKPTGTLGLIATNTIAQGDTREVGLDQLVSDGLTITRAVQSKPWPLASANLEYAAVWGTKSTLHPEVAKEVSGTITHSITTLLEPETRLNFIPERLLENERISFEGVKLTGMGFIVEQWQAREWIAKDTRNEKVLFPYLNGHDMNSRPDCSPSRWVIDFNNLSEEHAATYTQPFARVKGLVKPERDKNKRKVRRERWWQFAERQPGMRQAISELNEILAITLVSKTVMPMRVSTGQIFSHAVGLFATDSFIDQAVLSSTLHQMWAITYGSSMGMAPRYTPSDVFLTFPRPQPTPQLDEIGRTLDRERREIMLDRQLGVTKLYNLINDPQLPDSADADIARMRQIHRELDEIVMHAYGWADVQLEHGFHTYRQMTRWTVSSAARVEILDRLLEKNLRRANEQPQKAGAKAKKTSKAPAPDDRQGTLL